MEAQFLRIGQRFEVKHCKETMRDCICLRVSYTAVFISCEERPDLNSPWKRVRVYIGCASEVEPKDEIVDVTQNQMGQFVFESASEAKNKKERVKAKKAPAQGNGKRGRKAISVILPKGKFTIPEAAKANNVSVTAVYLKLLAMQKAGEAKIVGEKKAARGRSTKIWKVIAS